MDLGIAGRSAIVCGASRGLGFACAKALSEQGVSVVMIARDKGRLDHAAAQLQASGGQARTVAGDVSDPRCREDAMAVCPQPDILVTNAGGPPPGDFRDWERDDWIRALDLNMLAPIAFMRATVDGMIARRFGRIVNIVSSSVKAPIESLGLSNGARAGLVGFVAGLARETVAANVTINNILPGAFETDRTLENLEYRAKRSGKTVAEERTRRNARIPAGRAGDPAGLGDLCAYLCSAQAGYITGQNILIDGGRYPGVL
jgi:3-oxoacyl-[acyl-carrier protein] reductase